MRRLLPEPGRRVRRWYASAVTFVLVLALMAVVLSPDDNPFNPACVQAQASPPLPSTPTPQPMPSAPTSRPTPPTEVRRWPRTTAQNVTAAATPRGGSARRVDSREWMIQASWMLRVPPWSWRHSRWFWGQSRSQYWP